MNVLVTGGAGFIGSHLVDALIERGDNVTVIDNLSTGKRENVNKHAKLIVSDIQDGMSEDADVIFHLAAQSDVQTSVREPQHDALANIIGTIAILEAAQKSGAQVIFASTGGAIYGECESPQNEYASPLPMSPYGISKLCAETYVRGWNRIYDTNHIIFRFGNVYGPRQQAKLEGGVVAIFLERLADGQPTTIYGDGKQTRDFIYVGDVVEALLQGVGTRKSVYNVGTGVETSITSLHEMCAKTIGVESNPVHEPKRAGDVKRSALGVSWITESLGWESKTSLEEGLKQTLDWVKSSYNT
jgi:UDP-glucose 4-epimerase